MPLRSHESILIFYKKPPIYNPQKTFGHKPANSWTHNSSSGTNYGETKLGVSGGGQTDRYPRSILKFSVVNNDSNERIHPTQKPVELFEYLIKTYTNKDAVILDNCIGSGTAAIASINTERQWIGMDSDENFVKMALKRVENHIKQVL